MPVRFWLVAFFFSFLISALAFAFVPDSKFIFDGLTKNNTKISSYRIKQTRTFFSDRFGKGKLDVEEEIFLKVPWEYARKSVVKGKSRLIVYNGNRSVILLDNKWMELKKGFTLPLIYGFYLSADGHNLASFLSRRGIAMNDPSLARWGGIVALEFKGTHGLGVWLHREFYWPLAYSKHYAKDSDRVDQVFSNYKNVFSGVYFPMKITKYEGDTVVEQVRVRDVKPNAKISDTLFDISHIKRKYPKYKPGGSQVKTNLSRIAQ